jgi:hypothetical protein
MPQAATLITDALGLLGVVDPVEAIESEDAALGLRVLNRAIDSANGEQAMLYTVDYVSFTLPASTTSRTIGPSGDIALARPNRVETGGYASVGGVDYPIQVLTREQYAEVCLKALGSVAPHGVYYEPGLPNGRLYFWPVVSAATTIKLPIATKISTFAATTTSISMPEMLEDYLVNLLAIKLAPSYGRQVPQAVVFEAARLRRLIKRANFQAPQLQTDLPTRESASSDIWKYL